MALSVGLVGLRHDVDIATTMKKSVVNTLRECYVIIGCDSRVGEYPPMSPISLTCLF